MLNRIEDFNLPLWLRKWWYYEANARPWRRAQIHLEFARRSAFCRWPVHGDVLEAFRDGRLEIGEHTVLEPGVWLAVPPPAQLRIGRQVSLNRGVMIAALDRVEIGDYCLFANGCFVSDNNHGYADLSTPLAWQPYESKGPVSIGDNVWLGSHVTVTSGVTIGERCVIGANSVVTSDIPPFSVAAGVPARVIRAIDGRDLSGGRGRYW